MTLSRFPRVLLKTAVILAVFIACIVAIPVTGSILSYHRARSKSLAVLAAAHNPEELNQAVGWIGIVLQLKNGEWIAIRYSDSHQIANFFSCAIVRCSDGTWMESSRHFCGRLRNFRDRQEQSPSDASTAEAGVPIDEDGELDEVEGALDLTEAKQAMRRMGFADRERP